MPPALPKAGVLGSKTHEIFNRALSSFSSQDIEAVLSDALLSFSPLAILVGAESARALADSVTNVKQSFVACIAPVGALGMMATVVKGASLPGIKEMLGAGGQDIKDAARALGCAAIAGDVIPRMDENGGMVSNGTGYTLDQAACAIVRQKWQTGSRCKLDLFGMQRVPATFFAGTMSGRLVWKMDSAEKTVEMIQKFQEALSTPSYAGSSISDVFSKVNDLDGGTGTVELQWPAPAMPLETNPSIIYLYGCFFVASFICVAFLACSRILLWQSPISSGLLVAGQALLILGHVTAQCAVKSQREILKVRISVENPTHWLMVDKTRFTSAALRPLTVPRRSSFFRRSYNNRTAFVTLGQYHRFSNKYIATWHASLVLSALILGFIAFYIGGKSSDVKTIVIYIVLFILANVTKGPVVLYANKPHYTRLNNLGHEDMKDSGDPKYARPLPEVTVTMDRDASKSSESLSSMDIVLRNYSGDPKYAHPLPEVTVTMDRDASKSSEPLSSTDNEKSDLTSSIDTFPTPFNIYLKFFIRDRHATDVSFFSSIDEWILAAHVISKAVSPIQSSDLGHSNHPDDFLLMPLYLWNDPEKFHGLLLLAIDQIGPEQLFWNLGMEVMSSLMGDFGSPSLLCSHDKAATNTSFLTAFVFTCVRMLSSEHVYCGNVLLPCKLRGARSLMRAIEEVKRTTKEPSDTNPELHALLNDVADAAKKSKGATVKGKNMLAYEDMSFSRLSSKSAHSMLASLKKIDGCVERLRLVEELMEFSQSRKPDQFLLELKELRDMLRQLMDLELGVSLEGKIAQLSDKIQLIWNRGERNVLQIHLQPETSWELQYEALKDELRELAALRQFQRLERWYPQEMLRNHQRKRKEVLQLEGAVEREVWEAYYLVVLVEALLREGWNVIRNQLHREYREHQNELHQSSLQNELPAICKERQQQLERSISWNKQNIDRLRKNKPDDPDDEDERMFGLYQLEFRQTYLELELQEIQAINPAP